MGPTGTTDKLTFLLVDPDIESRETPGGLALRMLPEAQSEVVGARAQEAFSEGVHSWRIRLDSFKETLLGLVDARDSNTNAGDGFFWSPTRRHVHGQRGVKTAALAKHPIVQQGDVLKFIYDCDAGTLRVIHNGTDCGIICTDLRGMMSPSFILARGEGLTLLQ
eukprot:Sspe_Gene.39504::Locus_19056_Transcript_1_1_Confidence_1.000_Length_1431::g.39504::m.39504